MTVTAWAAAVDDEYCAEGLLARARGGAAGTWRDRDVRFRRAIAAAIEAQADIATAIEARGGHRSAAADEGAFDGPTGGIGADRLTPARLAALRFAFVAVAAR